MNDKEKNIKKENVDEVTSDENSMEEVKAEEETKQIYGGISPLGLSENIKIYIDQNVMSREKVFIGGGNRTTKLFLSPHSLQKISKGIVLDLAQS